MTCRGPHKDCVNKLAFATKLAAGQATGQPRCRNPKCNLPLRKDDTCVRGCRQEDSVGDNSLPPAELYRRAVDVFKEPQLRQRLEQATETLLVAGAAAGEVQVVVRQGHRVEWATCTVEPATGQATVRGFFRRRYKTEDAATQWVDQERRKAWLNGRLLCAECGSPVLGQGPACFRCTATARLTDPAQRRQTLVSAVQDYVALARMEVERLEREVPGLLTSSAGAAGTSWTAATQVDPQTQPAEALWAVTAVLSGMMIYANHYGSRRDQPLAYGAELLAQWERARDARLEDRWPGAIAAELRLGWELVRTGRDLVATATEALQQGTGAARPAAPPGAEDNVRWVDAPQAVSMLQAELSAAEALEATRGREAMLAGVEQAREGAADFLHQLRSAYSWPTAEQQRLVQRGRALEALAAVPRELQRAVVGAGQDDLQMQVRADAAGWPVLDIGEDGQQPRVRISPLVDVQQEGGQVRDVVAWGVWWPGAKENIEGATVIRSLPEVVDQIATKLTMSQR